jgi:hypothetical protein
MKQILIILGLFASVTTFAQSPRIKLNQITKDTVKGSVLISSPSDSGMVYSRDFYIAYGADTVLILYGDTLAATSGIISSVLSDGVTITGDGTTGNELKVDTSTVISTIQGLVDSLSNYVTTSTAQTISGAKTFTSDLNVDAKIALNAGDDNLVIGDGAGGSLVSGQTFGNVLIGINAGILINSGDFNTAVGTNALYLNSQGSNNIANGYAALFNNSDGNDNIANGFIALYDNTSGSNNIANGYAALYNNTSGNYNIANGREALYNNTSANYNVANGFRTLYNLSSGSNNQAYGFEAGRYLSNGSALTTANGSLFIGSNTRASAIGNSNEIVIGTDAIGNGSNTITIGSSSAQSLHTRNYEFDIDQTVSASEDNYVLTYDNGDGQISLQSIALSGSATLDFGSTSAQSSSDLTITVTGAADGDVVSLGVPNASVNANTNYTAWVSAANTVTVRFNNYSSGAVDPASGTFKVKVFK